MIFEKCWIINFRIGWFSLAFSIAIELLFLGRQLLYLLFLRAYTYLYTVAPTFCASVWEQYCNIVSCGLYCVHSVISPFGGIWVKVTNWRRFGKCYPPAIGCIVIVLVWIAIVFLWSCVVVQYLIVASPPPIEGPLRGRRRKVCPSGTDADGWVLVVPGPIPKVYTPTCRHRSTTPQHYHNSQWPPVTYAFRSGKLKYLLSPELCMVFVCFYLFLFLLLSFKTV